MTDLVTFGHSKKYQELSQFLFGKLVTSHCTLIPYLMFIYCFLVNQDERRAIDEIIWSVWTTGKR